MWQASATEFGSSSHLLSNRYVPWSVGVRFDYTGFGDATGISLSFEVLAQEQVDGINCLKVITRRSIDADQFVWLAQDTDGKVWQIQSQDTQTGDYCHDDVLYMPVTPALGDVFGLWDCFFDSDYIVTSLSSSLTTPLRSFSRCLVLRLDEFGDVEENWFVPGWGLAKIQFEGSENGGWHLSSVSGITASAPPNITMNPANFTGPPGTNVVFAVTANGATPLYHQWERKTAGSMDWRVLTNNGVYGGALTASLTVRITTLAMNGDQFRCVAINTGGSVVSSAATLTVISSAISPTFTIHPENQTVAAGDSASFVAVASGDPPLSYRWQRKPAGSENWGYLANDGYYSGVTTISLTVSGTSTAMSGVQFRCEVTNSAGTDISSIATLMVHYMIFPPLIISFTNGGAGFQFEFTTQSSIRYSVDYMDQLSIPDVWQPLKAVVGTGSIMTVADQITAPSRFYRVSIPSFGVHSFNVVGYVARLLETGTNLVANPFSTFDHSFQNLFPAMATGSTIDLWNGAASDRYELISGQWTPSGGALVPGAGAIFHNPGPPTTVVFVGEVPQGNLTNLLPNLSLRSSIVPIPGLLGFPAQNGDVIQTWNHDLQSYVTHSFSSGSWNIPPLVNPGESFWLSTSKPRAWTQEFTLEGRTELPDLVVTNILVPVTVASTEVFAIQWNVANSSATASGAAVWTDEVRLASEADWRSPNAIVLGARAHMGGLAAQSAYFDSLDIDAGTIPEGDYYVLVRTDTDHAVLEANRDNNTLASSSKISIRKSADENWSDRFGLFGVNGAINALAARGDSIYVGGGFTVAGNVFANNIARWDGRDWVTLSSGLNNHAHALAVSEANLYVGGTFTVAGGANANRIAKWDGKNWSALGGGLNGPVYSLAVIGTNLYVGGDFTTAGGIYADRIAKWDGNRWWPMGSLNGQVNALAVIGTDLYAGGWFNMAGGINANQIAKWNGSNWEALGSGLNSSVNALAVNDGDLYAGGWFTTAGGGAANRVAKWDGEKWSALANGLNADVRALATIGDDLYVGGEFTLAGSINANRIAKWDGTDWSALGSGIDGIYASANALTSVGSRLYVGGDFTRIGEIRADAIAVWEMPQWTALIGGDTVGGVGLSGGWVNSIAIRGTDVYVGGQFDIVGGLTANNTARWDGDQWSVLGDGVMTDGGPPPFVSGMTSIGTNLYAGGYFASAGDASAYHIARWDGSRWWALGNGLYGAAYALESLGTDLYVGGEFWRAGNNITVNHIARWDGNRWSALDAGVNGFAFPYTYALATRGMTLYVGGAFTNAGGLAANRIAKWEGNAWSTLGSGLNGTVYSLLADDTGLYVGGDFTSAGGIPANGVARWDGSNWSALGTGIANLDSPQANVLAMAIHETNLYVGGSFTLAGEAAARNIARWDGEDWATLGAGVNNRVKALAVSGDQLFVGGNFTIAGGKPSYGVGIWYLNSAGTIHSNLPTITAHPVDTGVVSGANVVFTISATGTAQLFYQWQRKPTGSEVWSNLTNGDYYSGATSPTLMVRGTTIVMNGDQFRCVVNTTGGSAASSAATLTVDSTDGAPTFTVHPQDQTVIASQMAVFMALASGDPPVAYQWQRQIAGSGAWSDLIDSVIYAGAATASLTVNNTTVVMYGDRFRCVATNFAGSDTSDVAILTVNSDSDLAYGNVIAWGISGQNSVPAGATNVIAIAGGHLHNLALRSSGTLIAWGYNGDGQTDVPVDASNVVAISAGAYHSMALRSDGVLLAWGQNDYGQINVPASAINIAAIAGGSQHSLVLRRDGTVVAWGYNMFAQTNVPPSATNLVAIAAGAQHNLGLKADGTVISWGWNIFGQTDVPAAATNVIAIAGGGVHSLALRSDGSVVAWGNNEFGQTNTPLSATNVVAIAAGAYHNLALRSDGVIIAWGRNDNGQTNMTTSATNVVAIAAGAYQNLALVNDGAPTVVRQPINQLAFAGMDIDFSVSAVGYHPLSYQWQLNGVNIVGASHSTLMLTNVQLYDTGSYQVVVTNAYGMTISSDALLTVLPPMRIEVSYETAEIVIKFPSIVGWHYGIEFRDNLSTETWKPLPGYEQMAGNGSPLMVLLTPTSPRQRFYRVVQLR